MVRKKRLAALALLFLFSMGIGSARVTQSLASWPTVETRYSVTLEGRVVSDPFVHPKTGRVIVRFLPHTINGDPCSLKLRLYLRGDAEPLGTIAYGQVLRVKGHIWANDPITNPHQFDFGEYLHRNGMDAISTAKIEDVAILGEKTDVRTYLFALRHAIGERIDLLFPRSSDMVRALLLGDRSLMSDELRNSLNTTGIAHLVSISGMHVSLLAFILCAGLRRFMPRWLANLLTIGPLMLYGALIGFPASFVRALSMFVLLGLSQFCGLPSDPVTRLCAVLMGFLLWNPLLMADAGFVLSFFASAGLILLMPPLHALLRLDRLPSPSHKQKRMKRLMFYGIRYLPELLCASLAAQLASLPAVIAWFGVQSVISLPFNLICVPLCMGGFLLATLALLLSLPLMPLGALLASLADSMLALLTEISRFGAGLPVTTVRIGRYPIALILLHGAVILAASELSRIRLNRRKAMPVLLIAVAALSSLYTWIRCVPFSVVFLDAEQADCAVLNTMGHTYVFDAGDTYTPVADYLNATCLHLDGVFLSHPHDDHAGGLNEILDSFRPDAIYVPEGWFDQSEVSEVIVSAMDRAKAMDIPVMELSVGDELALSDAVALSVYNPDGTFDNVNDMSLLLLAHSETHSVMFTGDLTMSGEPEVIPDCDILKVAHHGADNATSNRFLESASPDLAVISVGENNYGHPGDLTLWRLRESGARILRTDRCGAIRATVAQGEWHIKTWLEVNDELE